MDLRHIIEQTEKKSFFVFKSCEIIFSILKKLTFGGFEQKI